MKHGGRGQGVPRVDAIRDGCCVSRTGRDHDRACEWKKGEEVWRISVERSRDCAIGGTEVATDPLPRQHQSQKYNETKSPTGNVVKG